MAEDLRVKLEFEAPPPAVPESRHVWMLVRREELRAVTDLSCLLRERFYPDHRGAPPHLYIQDCLLPPGESIRLLRDGDLIRVKFDAYSPEDHETGSGNEARPTKKRRRHTEDESKEECSFTPKHKKRKHHNHQSHQKDKKRRGEKMIPEERTLEESTERYRKKLNKQTAIPEGTNSGESSEGSSKISKVIPEKRTSEMSSEKKKRKKKLIVEQMDSEGSSKRKKKNLIVEQMDSEQSSKRKKKKKKNLIVEQRDSEGSSEILRKKVHKEKDKPNKQVSEEFSSMKEVKKNRSPAKANFESQAKKVRARSSSDSSTSSSDDEPISIKKRISLVPETSTSNTSVAKMTPDLGIKSTTRNVRPVSSTELFGSTEKPSQELDSSINITLNKNSGTSSGVKNNKENSSSSSKSDSSEEDDKKPSSANARHVNGASNGCCEGDDSDSDTFVIKKPFIPSRVTTNGSDTGGVQQGPLPKPEVLGHGRGRGRDNPLWRGQGGRGFRGQGYRRNQNRGRGNPSQFFYNNEPQSKEQQLEEPATNVSVFIQNPPEPARKDYSSMPLLAAPPQVGKCIAFKLLELTENYTPEVSDYKEGRVLSFDPVTQQLEVELLSQQQRRDPGKFDLVYESEDGSRTVLYAAPQEWKVTQHWSTLIEPRLVIDNQSEVLLSVQS